MSLLDTFFGGDVPPLMALGVVAGSYVLGCFATGYYLVRQRTGQDIRELGSRSTGARNAGRALGRDGFWLTMAGDMAKGGLAVWLAWEWTGNDRAALLAWLAVVAGHVWPAQLGFRGGKGVSTSLMGLLVYDWRLALVFCIVFAAGMALARRPVAVSLAGFALLPAASWWLNGDRAQIWGISVVAAVVIMAHHRNVVDGMAELWSRRGTGARPDQSVKEL